MKKFTDWKFEQAAAANQQQNPENIAVSAPEGAEVEISKPEQPEQKPENNDIVQHIPKTPRLKVKPWKASKTEILTFWKGVKPDLPLMLKPIEYDHEGSTIQEDGIRITGSKEFITTVLSRLKDFLVYENPDSKLMLSYRQSPKSFVPGNRNSYSFYLQAKKRGKK